MLYKASYKPKLESVQTIVCVAGLPHEVAEAIRSMSPAIFTGDKTNLPILRGIKQPYTFRQGMSDYYLSEIAKRLELLRTTEDVGVALAYANSPGPDTESFVNAFFPYAVVAPFEPFDPDSLDERFRCNARNLFIGSVQDLVSKLRDRVSLVRDTLSGQNFSPLTLPLRNFRSDMLQPALKEIFETLGSCENPRQVLDDGISSLKRAHPVARQGGQLAYFSDDRELRFRSPGKNRHGMARALAESHQPSCLINARARLGGPLDAHFHYDCDYARRDLDGSYPNCHGTACKPSKRTHVNIAPNDSIH